MLCAGEAPRGTELDAATDGAAETAFTVAAAGTATVVVVAVRDGQLDSVVVIVSDEVLGVPGLATPDAAGDSAEEGSGTAADDDDDDA